MIPGVNPETETIIEECGGKQSKSLYAFNPSSGMSVEALLALASIVKYGEEKYGGCNWKKISTESHINHALIHFFSWLAGDTSDAHLEHALCRAMFALHTSGEVKIQSYNSDAPGGCEITSIKTDCYK